jgi:hypothetical protein
MGRPKAWSLWSMTKYSEGFLISERLTLSNLHVSTSCSYRRCLTTVLVAISAFPLFRQVSVRFGDSANRSTALLPDISLSVGFGLDLTPRELVVVKVTDSEIELQTLAYIYLTNPMNRLRSLLARRYEHNIHPPVLTLKPPR